MAAKPLTHFVATPELSPEASLDLARRVASVKLTAARRIRLEGYARAAKLAFERNFSVLPPKK